MLIKHEKTHRKVEKTILKHLFHCCESQSLSLKLRFKKLLAGHEGLNRYGNARSNRPAEGLFFKGPRNSSDLQTEHGMAVAVS